MKLVFSLLHLTKWLKCRRCRKADDICKRRWGGYFFDEAPLPDKSVGFTNIVDTDRHAISLGVGYKWFQTGWKLDVLYVYAWGDREISDVDYSQRIHDVALAISRRF